MKEIETLCKALAEVVASYHYLTDGVGTITDDAYLAAKGALNPPTPQDSAEPPTALRELSEQQCVDPFEISGGALDYVNMTSTAATFYRPANDPIDW
jgi:hypothetical protein